MSTVTRIGRLWDAILVTGNGFGALMCKQCAQSRGWGGIPLGEGVGEPRTGIILYIYIYISVHSPRKFRDALHADDNDLTSDIIRSKGCKSGCCNHCCGLFQGACTKRWHHCMCRPQLTSSMAKLHCILVVCGPGGLHQMSFAMRRPHSACRKQTTSWWESSSFSRNSDRS